MKSPPLLRISDLHVQFDSDEGIVRAVDGVSFDVASGETLALVGESGCGKSVTAMSILGLMESQGGKVTQGSIEFLGRDLLKLDEPAMQRVRGNDIAMIFQEPMTSLNPVFTIGDQIGETLRKHRGLNPERTRAETLQLLDLVGMPDPEQRLNEYPHQHSGGMRQRVMIAMALSCRPKLLIADEPTTALDVTVQAQILELMADLQKRFGMAVLLITHDLGVVAANAHRVAVMYAGRIVETASVYDLFEAPGHPYTAGLLSSLPQLEHRGQLTPIAGNVPDVLSLPSGCAFHPRCRFRLDRCDEERPELLELGGKRNTRAACFVTQDQPDLDLRRIDDGRGPSPTPREEAP